MNKIPYEERCEVYAAARKKFGAHMQTMVAIEEMSEVIRNTNTRRAVYSRLAKV